VEYAAKAAVPPTQTCMNCHTQVVKDSPNLAPLRESYEKGTPVLWNRVHDLPDYAYFNHSAHVTRGVSCVECHGRVDRMAVVTQEAPLSMSWCLECHRNPESKIRNPQLVTHLGWTFNGDEQAKKQFANEAAYHEFWFKQNHINTGAMFNPLQDCSTCHR
jgi:hypothetical protein